MHLLNVNANNHQVTLTLDLETCGVRLRQGYVQIYMATKLILLESVKRLKFCCDNKNVTNTSTDARTWTIAISADFRMFMK